MSTARRARPRALAWFIAGSLLWGAVDLLQVGVGTGGQSIGRLVPVVLGFYAVCGLLAATASVILRLRSDGAVLATAVFVPGTILAAAHVNFVYVPDVTSLIAWCTNLAWAALSVLVWLAAARSTWARRIEGSIAALVCTAACAAMLSVLATAGWSRPGAARPAPEAAADRPDVFVIVIDSLRADRAYRSSPEVMPALRALAATGVSFENAYAQASWTKPSVASLMTSLYPASHQANYRRDRVSPDALLLPEWFRDLGYETAVFSANPWVSPAFGFDRGVDVFFETERETFSRHVLLLRILRALDRALDGRAFSRAITTAERAVGLDADRRSNCERDRAILGAFRAWLAEPAKRPRFAYAHLMSPHLPYRPPEGPEDVSDQEQVDLLMRTAPLEGPRLQALISLYEQTVAHADSVLADLVAAIRSADRGVGSIFVVSADHGEEFFEHGRFGHGKTLYREVIRVPLVIAATDRETLGWPDALAAGAVRDEPVMLIDVAPTLAQLIGAADAPQWRGSSVLTPESGRNAYAELLREGGLETYMTANTRRSYIESKAGIGAAALEELYDLVSDPGETRALAVPAAEPLRDALARERSAARAAALARDANPHDNANEERLRALGYLN